MSLRLNKSAWGRVILGEVVRHVTNRVDAEASGLERFLAGEHIPSGCLATADWGVIGRDPIGPMFYKRFQPGHVLYVSRRTYLRKVAVPDFEGITGEKTFVLESIDRDVLLQEFLPFVLSAEVFHEYAIRNSRGSVNPYLNWGELVAYEFDLPPLDLQRQIADLLWAVEGHRLTVTAETEAVGASRIGTFRSWLNGITSWTRLGTQFEVQLGKMLSKTSQPTDHDLGFPYLANVNVRWNDFDLSDLRYVRLDAREREKFLLRSGDILVCEGGEVGRAAIWDSRLSECYYQKALHRLRPRGVASLPGPLLVAFLELLAVEGRLAAHSTGTTFGHLTRERLIEVEIPAVSTAEVVAGQEALGVLDRASDALSIELSALSDLRSSLLADIFGGG